ncbi:hypothetical protein AMTR_s00149p00086550 [Amborella trichopoda]|uniref:Uncharacterized protein n=1 Tax=Amborella trichopoda TaxID=13333 RepID=W1PMN1_AMBTC|nr:hypothetical protein AMTR_s00149p00086550 [Amborella trichopoda]
MLRARTYMRRSIRLKVATRCRTEFPCLSIPKTMFDVRVPIDLNIWNTFSALYSAANCNIFFSSLSKNSTASGKTSRISLTTSTMSFFVAKIRGLSTPISLELTSCS